MKWTITMCWLACSVSLLSYAEAKEQESNWGRNTDIRDTGASRDAADQGVGYSSILDKVHNISGPDPQKYGLRRGCVLINRIKNIRFKDDQTAIADLGRDIKLLLRLRNACQGIRRDGFEYESRQGKICENFSQFTVIGKQMGCTLKSITPYVELESVRYDEKS